MIQDYDLLTKGCDQIGILPGLTLSAALDRTLPVHLRRQEGLTVFNHGVVIRDHDNYIINEGDRLLVGIVPSGGGGNRKGVLGVIIGIVLMVATYGMYGWQGIMAGGLASNLFVMGAGLVLSGLGSMLVKPPSLGTGLKAQERDSQYYGITGQSNEVKPYAQIARLYGRHKVYPALAAQPIIENVGTLSTLSAIYDFGLGWLNLTDIFIGDTPLAQYNPVYNIYADNKTITPRLAAAKVGYDQYSYALGYNEIFQTTTKEETIYAVLDLSFVQGLVEFDKKNGDKLSTSVTVGVQYRLKGTTTWIDVPVGNYSAPGCSVAAMYVGESRKSFAGQGNVVNEWRWGDIAATQGGAAPGTAYQSPWDDTSLLASDGRAAVQATGVYDYIEYDTFQWYATTVGRTYAGMQLSVPSGAGFKDPILSRGPLLTSAPDPAAAGYSVKVYGLMVSAITADYSPTYVTITGQITSPFVAAVYITPPSVGEYEVRVIRATTVSTSTDKYNAMSVTMLKSYLSGGVFALKHRHTMLEIRLRASERLSGVVQNLSAVAISVLPYFNASGGLVGWYSSRNPAWIALDILIGEGNPRPVPSSMIDWPSWHALSIFCDQSRTWTVNGKKITGPRFTCDVVIDYAATVKELIESVLSCCRASLIITQTGKYGVLIDQEQTIPRQLITPSNSWDFAGARTYPAETHALRITFIEASRNYQRQEIIVYADGYSASNATKFEEVGTFGITDFYRAWAFGRFFMAQAIYRSETFTVKMDIEYLAVQRGNLVYLQHDVPLIGGFSARVVSVVGSQIEIAQEISVVVTGYSVRQDDGTIRSGKVVSVEDATHMTLDDVTGITADTLVTIGIYDNVTEPFLVQAIEPENEFVALLTLVRYKKEIYDADITTLPPWDPAFGNDIINATDCVVTDLKVVQTTVYVNRAPIAQMAITFSVASPFYSHANIYINYAGGLQTLIATTIGFDVIDEIDLLSSSEILAGDVTYSVVPYTSAGLEGKAASVTVTLVKDTIPPAPVVSFQVDVQNETVVLQWHLQPDLDTSYHEIRYSPDPVDGVWAQAQYLAVVPWDTVSLAFGARTGKYMLRTFDTSGNASPVVYQRTTIEKLPNLDLFVEIDDSPLDWPGQLYDVVRVSDVLVRHRWGSHLSWRPHVNWRGNGDTNARHKWGSHLSWRPHVNWRGESASTGQAGGLISAGEFGHVAPDGYYYVADIIDMFEVFEVRVSDKHVGRGVLVTDFMSQWVPLASASPLSSADAADWTIELEYRVADRTRPISSWPSMADPMADPIASGSATWSPWRVITVGDVTGRMVQFRYYFTSRNPWVKARLDSGLIVIDVKEWTWHQNDIAVPQTGIRVDFSPAFADTPTLAVTLENTTATRYEITNKSRTGFDIDLFDGAVATAGQIDVSAIGYGRQAVTSI